MIGRSVAIRYVRAAFDLACQQGVLDRTQRQLQALESVVRAGPELTRLLRHPSLAMERKLGGVDAVLDEPAVAPVRRLVALLVENGRIEVLTVAAELLQDLADQSSGVIRARVVTPVPLRDEQAERLRNALSAWRGAPVRLDLRQDPGLVGGIVVRIGDRVLDASIRGRLERVARRLGQS